MKAPYPLPLKKSALKSPDITDPEVRNVLFPEHGMFHESSVKAPTLLALLIHCQLAAITTGLVCLHWSWRTRLSKLFV